MRVDRRIVQVCCGGTSIILKTDRPIMPDDINKLVGLGFKETANFTKSGILYVDNTDLIVTGPLGSDRLQVRCKIRDEKVCDQKIKDFEVLIQQLG